MYIAKIKRFYTYRGGNNPPQEVPTMPDYTRTIKLLEAKIHRQALALQDSKELLAQLQAIQAKAAK